MIKCKCASKVLWLILQEVVKWFLMFSWIIQPMPTRHPGWLNWSIITSLQLWHLHLPLNQLNFDPWICCILDLSLLCFRFEAGTPAIGEAIGLGAAIDYLSQIGMQNIHDYEVIFICFAIPVLFNYCFYLFLLICSHT